MSLSGYAVHINNILDLMASSLTFSLARMSKRRQMTELAFTL